MLMRPKPQKQVAPWILLGEKINKPTRHRRQEYKGRASLGDLVSPIKDRNRVLVRLAGGPLESGIIVQAGKLLVNPDEKIAKECRTLAGKVEI